MRVISARRQSLVAEELDAVVTLRSKSGIMPPTPSFGYHKQQTIVLRLVYYFHQNIGLKGLCLCFRYCQILYLVMWISPEAQA